VIVVRAGLVDLQRHGFIRGHNAQMGNVTAVQRAEELSRNLFRTTKLRGSPVLGDKSFNEPVP